MKKNHPVGEGSWVKNTSSGGEVLTHTRIGWVQLKGQRHCLTDMADASNTWEHLGTLTSFQRTVTRDFKGPWNFPSFGYSFTLPYVLSFAVPPASLISGFASVFSENVFRVCARTGECLILHPHIPT